MLNNLLLTNTSNINAKFYSLFKKLILLLNEWDLLYFLLLYSLLNHLIEDQTFSQSIVV